MARDLVLEVVEQVRGNALGQAATDLDKVADKTDKASGAAKGYSTTLKQLDTQITSTKLKIQQLGAEFVATGDKATAKDLRGERSVLAQLEKIRKELEKATPGLAEAAAAAGANAGGGFLSGFFDTLAELPGKLRGSLLAIVTAAVVAASPAIGGALAGAVIGGVGVGGLAGGIAAASRDGGVRAAASEFGKSVSAEFFAGGQSFVEPTIESLRILQNTFNDLDLGESWERIAPVVTHVAEGIAGLGREFMPGFNRALDRAGPGLEILARELPQIGDALGDMIGDIAESEGALEGWLFVLDGVESAIRVTGDVISFFSDRFHDLVDISIEVSGVLEDLPSSKFLAFITGGAIDVARFNDRVEGMRGTVASANSAFAQAGDLIHRVTNTIHQQGDAANALADAVKRLNEEYSDYLDLQLGVDNANRRVAESVIDLNKAIKENGKDWRDNTEAGLANRAALTAAVGELVRQRQAAIEAGEGSAEATAKANQKFAEQLAILEKIAVGAGISKQALQDLVGDYRINVNVTTSGGDAYNNALARAIAGKVTVSGFAAGGDPPIGEPFAVGERGPELMMLTPRPHVFSNQESKAMTTSTAQVAADTAAALSEIKDMLKKVIARPPTVININAPEGTSPRELSAIVSREQAWSR